MLLKDKAYYIRKLKEALGCFAVGALWGLFMVLLIILEATVC